MAQRKAQPKTSEDAGGDRQPVRDGGRPPARLRELYVISDLHLGGEVPEDQLCTLDAELAALTDHVRQRAEQLATQPSSPEGVLDPAAPPVQAILLLAGDIVDFLIPNSRPGGYLRQQEAARDTLQAALKQYPRFVEALRKLLGCPRAGLVLLLGNHDLELAYHRVWHTLVQALAPTPASAARLFALHDGDTGYTCQIGPAHVRVVHGNAVDWWNEVNYRQLRAFLGDPACDANQWPANPGTRLVIDLMNKLKAPKGRGEGKGYSFVDLLKPETRLVLPILFSVEPTPDVLRMLLSLAALSPRLGLNWFMQKVRRIFGRSGMSIAEGALDSGSVLGLPTVDSAADLRAFLAEAETYELSSTKDGCQLPATVLDEQALLLQAEQDFLRGRRPSELLPDFNADLGLTRYLWQLNVADFPRESALRELLADLMREQNPFSIHHPSEFDRSLCEENRRLGTQAADFLIAGHSHVARAIETADGRYYFNAGTWMQLMRLSPATLSSDANFLPFYQATISDRKPLPQLAELGHTWQRPTLVRIREQYRGGLCWAEGELFRVRPPVTPGTEPLIPMQEWPFVVRGSQSSGGQRDV